MVAMNIAEAIAELVLGLHPPPTQYAGNLNGELDFDWWPLGPVGWRIVQTDTGFTGAITLYREVEGCEELLPIRTWTRNAETVQECRMTLWRLLGGDVRAWAEEEARRRQEVLEVRIL